MARAFGDRYSGALDRLQRGYGPRMGRTKLELPPPFNSGIPGPLPSGNNALFDWNPAVDPFTDQVGGIAFTGFGPPTFETQSGMVAGVFSGANYLKADSCPFSNLQDLTGGVSVYVVCALDSGAASTDGPFSMDQGSHDTANEKQISMYSITATPSMVCALGDDTTYEFDLGPNPTLGAIQVWSMHIDGSSIDGRLDGTSNGSTAHTRALDEQDLDRFIIGAVGAFGGADAVSGYFEGNIWRILVCEGAYNQDVQDYLAAQYTAAAPAATKERLIFDWNPAVDPYADLVGGLTATASGAGVTFGVQRTLPCATFDGTDYLTFDGTPFSTLSDLTTECSIYVVCERTDAASEADILVGIDDNDDAGVDHAMYLAWAANDAVQAAQANASTSNGANSTASAVNRDELVVVSGHLTLTTGEVRLDGSDITSSGSPWTSSDPTGMTRVTIGAGGYFGGGIALPFTGHIWRVLIYDAAYNADVVDGL